MTEIKTYCDHCGKELNEMHDYCGTEVGITDFMDADLCVACVNELQDLVRKFVSKRSEQQSEDDHCNFFKNKADVVEVVRCKDCKHSTERQGFENHMWNDDCVMCDHIAPSDRIPMNKNNYCSYGERKCENG